MDEYQKQLKQYISSHLQAGTAADAIRGELLRAGWPADMVDEAFTQLKGISLPAPVTAPDSEGESAASPGPEQQAPATEAAAHQEQQQPPDQAQSDMQVPQKYTVFRSIIDGCKAMKHNFPAYLSATVSSMLIAGVVIEAFTAVVAIILLKAAEPLLRGSALTGLVVSLGIIMGLSLIFYAIAYSFMTAAISYPLMSGADNKQDSVFAVLLHALRRTPKLMIVNATVYLIAIAPFFLIFILLLLLLFVHVGSGAGATGRLLLVPLLEIAALIWAFIAFFRYSLTPYVVIFEEKDTIRQALKRSNHLLSGGGKWFLFKGSVLVIVVVFVFLAITGQNLRQFQQSDSIMNSVFALIVLALVNNSMVMLYRNRRIVRGPSEQ